MGADADNLEGLFAQGLGEGRGIALGDGCVIADQARLAAGEVGDQRDRATLFDGLAQLVIAALGRRPAEKQLEGKRGLAESVRILHLKKLWLTPK